MSTPLLDYRGWKLASQSEHGVTTPLRDGYWYTMFRWAPYGQFIPGREVMVDNYGELLIGYDGRFVTYTPGPAINVKPPTFC